MPVAEFTLGFFYMKEVKGIINTYQIALLSIGIAFLAFFIGYAARKYIAEARIASAEEAARRIVEEEKMPKPKREARLESKEEARRVRRELEREHRERRAEHSVWNADWSNEKKLGSQTGRHRKEEELLDKKDKSIQTIKAGAYLSRVITKLERISGLTVTKRNLLLATENDIRHEV